MFHHHHHANVFRAIVIIWFQIMLGLLCKNEEREKEASEGDYVELLNLSPSYCHLFTLLEGSIKRILNLTCLNKLQSF